MFCAWLAPLATMASNQVDACRWGNTLVNTMPQLFLRHFWLIAIAATIVNALILWVRSRRHVHRDQALESGYRTLFWGLLIWGNLPWVIMGLGVLVGGVPTVLHYLRPRDGNPYVLAFYASGVLIGTLASYWLLARGGAEMIARHPGILRVDIENPAWVKLLWCLCLGTATVAMLMMFIINVPIPSAK
jgi:hypothetical protein